jgi:endonuclease G
MPTTDVTRVFDGYIASYNYRTRNPNWVLEHLTQDGMDGEGNR